MKRRDGLRRAAAFDKAGWSDYTRGEFERTIRVYAHAAKAAGQQPNDPGHRWLVDYFREVRKTQGQFVAMRRARYVATHLLEFDQTHAPMADMELRRILEAPDGVDPSTFDLKATSPRVNRVNFFLGSAYGISTLQGYSRHAKRWTIWCRNAEIDPRRPPKGAVAEWLVFIAQRDSPRSVRNAKNALSYFYRVNELEDHTLSADVRHVLESAERANPPEVVRPYTVEERLKIVSDLGEATMDLRDRVFIIFICFGSWSAERLSYVNVEQCSIDDRGVTIAASAGGRALYIGRNQEPSLDIGTWLPRWLDRIDEKGPLFRPMDSRTSLPAARRMSPQPLQQRLVTAVKRSGLDAGNAAARLRYLFEIECRECAPALVLRHDGITKGRGRLRDEETRSTRLVLRRKRWQSSSKT